VKTVREFDSHFSVVFRAGYQRWTGCCFSSLVKDTMTRERAEQLASSSLVQVMVIKEACNDPCFYWVKLDRASEPRPFLGKDVHGLLLSKVPWRAWLAWVPCRKIYLFSSNCNV